MEKMFENTASNGVLRRRDLSLRGRLEQIRPAIGGPRQVVG